jgi:phosphomannomutase / phosphoglucomutase
VSIAPDADSFPIITRLGDYFRAHYDVTEIDGVRVNFDDGWGLVRASNTQPALVLHFEANDETRLNEIRRMFEAKLKEMGGLS